MASSTPPESVAPDTAPVPVFPTVTSQTRKAGPVTNFILLFLESTIDPWYRSARASWLRRQPIKIYTLPDTDDDNYASTALPLTNFKSEAWFQTQLNHGRPMFVILTIPGCPFSRQILQANSAMNVAAERYKDLATFVVVDCARHKSFCRRRSPEGMPWIELFYVAEKFLPSRKNREGHDPSKSQSSSQSTSQSPPTMISVNVVPFTKQNFDWKHIYGYDSFFKVYGDDLRSNV